MSKFHATAESMDIDGKRKKPTYEQLEEELKNKDKQIEDLLIGDSKEEEAAGNSKTEVNKCFPV